MGKKKTWNQKGKKKGVRVLSTAQREDKKILRNIKKSIQHEGLKLIWIKFIDELFANGGKQARAYQKVFSPEGKKMDIKTAGVMATRLLRNDNVQAEINYRLNAQRATDDFIKDGLVDIATRYRGEKTIRSAVKSLEILAKMKGMLIDTKKIAFDTDNPAVFLGVYSPKEKEDFDKMKDNNQRLIE